MTKVSFIVPNYNHGDYLGQRLETVFARTIQHFEVILVGGCSTNSNFAVLDPYTKDPRLKVVLNASNSGSQRSKTRSDALELMEGIDVYTFVARHLPLDKFTKRKVLMEQTKVWGTLSWSRRLGWKIGRDIYVKIAAGHPEIRWLKTLRILSAFAVYYFSTPLRYSRARAKGVNNI